MENPHKRFLVDRTCIEIDSESKQRAINSLTAYRNASAYVLLGDPGAGKTETFKKEAHESNGTYIVARDFILFDHDIEKHDSIFFIDGLDEMRSGSTDGRTPLDQIRVKLAKLGRPQFRLSCREADWLGASDASALVSVSPDEKIKILHLNPLTNQDVLAVLQNSSAISNPELFIEKAQHNGLNELLRNPQTLNLLTQIVGETKWPTSRTALYDLASRQLVREFNSEHYLANSTASFSVDLLLDAAGLLCAVQLLSGISGYAKNNGTPSTSEYVELHAVNNPRQLPLSLVQKTNLFHSERENCFKPIHRSMSEYLGARYIAKIIKEDHLPIGRVFALLTGGDGGVVTDLRGLSAWLSVHCLHERDLFIDCDPLGVVLYGDVKGFSIAEKHRILTAMHIEALRFPWFRSEDWSTKPFGALCTKEMEPVFKNILESKSRKDADQTLVNCVLDAVRYGDALPNLTSSITSIIRDHTFRSDYRQNALQALLKLTKPDNPLLISIAEDVRTGVIEDKDHSLLGHILTNFYPQIISPARIFDFLRIQAWENSINEYFTFWIHQLPNSTPTDYLPTLLDQVSKRKNELNPILHAQQLNRMIGQLLVRALSEIGNVTSHEQLYDWLGIGLNDFISELERDDALQIKLWLEGHPNLYKAIIEIGVQQSSSQDNIVLCGYSCLARLYGAAPPGNIEDWYLSKAREERNDHKAQIYFDLAFGRLREKNNQSYMGSDDFEFLSDWVENNSRFQPWFKAYLMISLEHSQHKFNIEARQRRTEREKIQNENKVAWLKFVREHVNEIRDGSAAPNIFYDLACAFKGHLIDVTGETPLDRITNFLGNDPELVSAAFSGFHKILYRADLPSASVIFDLELTGQMHFLCWPSLIGIEQLTAENPENILNLENSILSSVIAFRFADHLENEPSWFLYLMKERPSLVSEILTIYTLQRLQAKKEHISTLYSLTFNDFYAEVAQLCTPLLLENYPLRSNKNQITHSLSLLLKAALRHLPPCEFLPLVEKRVLLKSLDSTQKIFWMTCGLLLNPQKFQTKLHQYLGKNQVRQNYFAEFLQPRGEDEQSKIGNLPDSTLIFLIETLGPQCQSERQTGVYWVSPKMETSNLVYSLLKYLSDRADENVVSEFERLLTLPDLVNWHNPIRSALHQIRIARRKTTFHHLSSAEVSMTLANLEPTSASDLAALVFDHLTDLKNKIRNGNANEYRQYWSYDSENKTLHLPKPENDCRDILYSLLSPYFRKLHVEVAKEGNYADDMRADLKISYRGVSEFNIPIEIKKDYHRDLWKAIDTQLIAKYVRDPGTDGHGIYLVFWFGQNNILPSPQGKKPRSSSELEQWLTSLVPLDKRYYIKVCVIDCSLPK
ncbi:hypothetical protein E2I14_18690 [Sapientia aquatica]|uniref:Uncharacterized protein n=1 Tax=Sapientia aquatica TaxID=1549640 RepID=A0A4V3ATE8_9BURK|nr:hypothetical protein E2I14_18690 [Sapientia aquatica]